MASYVSRHSATRIGAGNSGAARINQSEQIVPMPFLWQLTLEGNVWIAGHGHGPSAVETPTDGEAALNDQTPTFFIAAPATGTVVALLELEVRMVAEGGAAPDLYVTYVRPDVVGTYTALDKENLLGGQPATSSAARAGKTGSSFTALADATSVLLVHKADILDNLVSVEAATTRAQVQSLSIDPLWLRMTFYELPFMLYKGSGVYVHTSTGTADSTYQVMFKWAELAASVYVA